MHPPPALSVFSYKKVGHMIRRNSASCVQYFSGYALSVERFFFSLQMKDGM